MTTENEIKKKKKKQTSKIFSEFTTKKIRRVNFKIKYVLTKNYNLFIFFFLVH